MSEWLNNWWMAIPVFEKFFWFLAIPFTVLTVLQLIMTFIGMGDSDVDVDVDADISADGHDHHFGDSLKFFTVKNFIIFLTAFGWMGIACTRSGFPNWLTLFLALLSGIITIVVVAWVFYMLYKLGESGTFTLRDAIGHNGTVYLTIPSQKKGKGQIQLSVKGALREVDAVTYEEDDLKTGTNITVVELYDPNTVTVIKSI
jgi:hypothetical protein